MRYTWAGQPGAFHANAYGLRHPVATSCLVWHLCLLAAAPTATPCFRHWRRLLLLQTIPSPALLPDGNRVPPQRIICFGTSLSSRPKKTVSGYAPSREKTFGAARRPRQMQSKIILPLNMARAHAAAISNGLLQRVPQLVQQPEQLGVFFLGQQAGHIVVRLLERKDGVFVKAHASLGQHQFF